MAYKLKLQIDGLPKRFNQSQGSHWSVRHRESKKWLKLVNEAIVYGRFGTPRVPLTKAKLTLVRCSARAPDADGLVQSFKPVVDAFKKLNIIIDDNMNVIGMPTYQWEKAPMKKGFIRIELESVEDQKGES